MSNGTCVAWGFTNVYGTGAAYGTMVPTNLNLTNVSAIACGWQFNLALSSNGTLTAWGLSDPAFGSPTNLPGDLITNVAAVAAGGNNGVAMRKNGTVEAWGDSYDGVTNVPYGLSNVVAVATGGAAGLALQADGAVVTWGYPAYTNIPVGLATAKAISAGLEHNLAIRTGSLTPLITQEPADEYGVAGGSVTFAGSGVALALVQYQWQFNGTSIMGATNATLTLMNLQATNEGNYQVVMTDIAGSITSSVATLTLVPPPQIVSISPPANSTNWITMSTFVNVTVNAIGQSVFPLHYLTTFNGSPTRDSLSLELGFAAGYDLSNEGNYSLVISNAAGATTNMTWNFRSALPGEVIPWGADASGECDQVYGMSNATWIAAGDYHSTAVTESGTIVQWGDYFDGALVSPPSHTNYVATAAGLDHDIGLLDNGTVVTWGCSSADANYVPTNLGPAQAVACGWYHNVALLTNGSVVAWGVNAYGVTNVPSDLTNANAATAIAASYVHSLALRANGTVEAWGYNGDGETNVPAGLTNIVAIAAGGGHCLALSNNGTVAAWGATNAGQCNVPAGLSNVMAIAAGWEHSLALKNDGTLVAWGANSNGQANIPVNQAVTNIIGPPDNETNITPASMVKLITASSDHTMAAIFNPIVQYQLNVAQDLLLIYNSTNISFSSNVCAYYLAHRPMVSNANVLGFPCPTNEGITWSDYTNTFCRPIVNWLSSNPTKRPLYVILFQDLPTRITNGAYTINVHYQHEYRLQQLSAIGRLFAFLDAVRDEHQYERLQEGPTIARLTLTSSHLWPLPIPSERSSSAPRKEVMEMPIGISTLPTPLELMDLKPKRESQTPFLRRPCSAAIIRHILRSPRTWLATSAPVGMVVTVRTWSQTAK